MPTSEKNFINLQKLTGCTLSYEALNAEIDKILATTEKERDEKLKAYFQDLMRIYIESGLRHRMDAEFDPSVLAPGIMDRDINATKITADLGDMLKSVLAEKDTSFANKSNEHGTTPEERRDIAIDCINRVGKERTELESTAHLGRKADIGFLSDSLEELVVNYKHSPGFTFDPESTNDGHTKSAALYIQYEARKARYDEESKNSRGWRFRNFINRWRTRRFFAKCEKYFHNIGFDTEKHAELIKAKYASKMPEYISYQIDIAKDTCTTALLNKAALERMQNTAQINVARDKYKQATELNKNPQTSFGSQVSHLISKYDVPVNDGAGLQLVHSNFESMAESYDKERDFTRISTEVRIRFNSVYGMFLSSSLKKGNFDPVEVLKDANEFTTLELKYFTPIYEHADAKEFANNNLFANVSDKVLGTKAINTVNSFRKRNNMEPLTEEEANEMRDKISTYVNEEREKNARRIEEENKANELQNEENIINEEQNVANAEEVNNDQVRIPIKGIILDDNSNTERSPVHQDPEKQIEMSKMP
jgi:hypothetical protein